MNKLMARNIKYKKTYLENDFKYMNENKTFSPLHGKTYNH